MLATATAMTASTPGILTALLVLPLVGAFLVSRFRKGQEKQIKATAVFFAVIVFVASLYLMFAPTAVVSDIVKIDDQGNAVPVFAGDHELSGANAALEFAAFEHVVLLDDPNITWCLGVDGISLWLVLLTTFLTPLVLLASYETIKDHVREYFIAFLILETGMIGALVSLDLVVFYAFFELMLIPMYLIIGVWGHDRRIFAAVKFFIYTMVGSLLMFVAIIACYVLMPEGHRSFNLLQIYEHLGLGPGAQSWVFLAFALGFAIKVPVFPFHTWLPDAHVEAPTGGSIILAGVLLKMGTYGFIRFCLPMFPYASWFYAPLLLTLGVIGVIFAAWMAWVQDDLKKLVAYSSVSHLGFAMLGIFAVTSLGSFETPQHTIAGLTGASFIGISHGLTAAALFMLVGVIYNRRHTRLIDEFGGLAKPMPWFAACFMIALLGSVGLPGTSGFVGEFSVLLGAFSMQDSFTFLFVTISYWWFALLGGLGVIFGAVYMLSVYRRVFFGALPDDANAKTPDMNRLDKVYVVPVLALIMLLGIFPGLILDGRNGINQSSVRLDKVRHARMQQFAADHPDALNDSQRTKVARPYPPESERLLQPQSEPVEHDAHADMHDAGHGDDAHSHDHHD